MCSCITLSAYLSRGIPYFIHDDVIKWKHFPRYWSFVRGIHRSPVNSPHKGQWRGALMFSFICVWINGWVNNREAGDLRRNRARYDVNVMIRLKSRGHVTLSPITGMINLVPLLKSSHCTCWRHQMETFSAFCAGNSPVRTKASDAELWCFLSSASE